MMRNATEIWKNIWQMARYITAVPFKKGEIAVNITVNFGDLNISSSSSVAVRDTWQQTSLGTAKHCWTSWALAHGVVALKLRAITS